MGLRTLPIVWKSTESNFHYVTCKQKTLNKLNGRSAEMLPVAQSGSLCGSTGSRRCLLTRSRDTGTEEIHWPLILMFSAILRFCPCHSGEKYPPCMEAAPASPSTTEATSEDLAPRLTEVVTDRMTPSSPEPDREQAASQCPRCP